MKRKKPWTVLLLILMVLTISAVSACGRKGDLYLPDKNKTSLQ